MNKAQVIAIFIVIIMVLSTVQLHLYSKEESVWLKLE